MMAFTSQDRSTSPPSNATQTTLVTKMADLCTRYAERGSYVVMDAYFACAPVLKRFRRHPLYLMSRVRCFTVARAPFSRVPMVQGRGRPRHWGSKVKLQTLFAPLDQCQHAQVWLYGHSPPCTTNALSAIGIALRHPFYLSSPNSQTGNN
jgi:hypothetical protein